MVTGELDGFTADATAAKGPLTESTTRKVSSDSSTASSTIGMLRSIGPLFAGLNVKTIVDVA